jgi:hypothetical protein
MRPGIFALLFPGEAFDQTRPTPPAPIVYHSIAPNIDWYFISQATCAENAALFRGKCFPPRPRAIQA